MKSILQFKRLGKEVMIKQGLNRRFTLEMFIQTTENREEKTIPMEESILIGS